MIATIGGRTPEAALPLATAVEAESVESVSDRILAKIARCPSTIDELASALRVSENVIKYRIGCLMDAGIVWAGVVFENGKRRKTYRCVAAQSIVVLSGGGAG